MSPQTQIGIEWTDTTIRMISASRKGQVWSVDARVKQELPAGAIVLGEIQNAQQCVDALKKAMTKLKSTAPAILCLPSRKVYTSLLILESGMTPTDEIVRSKAIGLFPESMESMYITWKVLTNEKSGVKICVTAVRKNALEQYQNACALAGIRIRGVTTAPGAVASAQEREPETFLLLVKTSEDVAGCVSFLHHGSIIDEAILAADAKDATLIAAARTMMEEYATKGLPVQSIVVAGPETMLDAIRAALAPSSQKKGAVAEKSAVQVTPLKYKARDLEWVGALSAITHGNQSILNFLPKKKISQRMKLLVAVLLFAGALALIGYTQRSWLFLAPLPASPTVSVSVVSSSVSSVSSDSPSIAWAKKEGIFMGEGEKMFLADSTVSRQEFLRAVLHLSQFEEKAASSLAPSGFTDINNYPDLLPLLRYAKDKGMVGGTEFRPDDDTTVATALKMAYVGLGLIDPKGITAEPWYAPYRNKALKDGVLADPSVSMDAPLTHDMAVFMLWKIAQ